MINDKIVIELGLSGQKSILITWETVPRISAYGPQTQWFYEYKGWKDSSLECALSGTAPIDKDIKAILKQVLCEAVDKMEEG